MSRTSPTAPPARPQVLLVDVDRRVQQSLADLLGLTGQVTIVGCAADTRSALELIERRRPDVVVVDPRLPDLDGGRALVARIERTWPGVRVVLTGWASEPDDELGPSARYVSKTGTPEEFLAAMVGACCAVA